MSKQRKPKAGEFWGISKNLPNLVNEEGDKMTCRSVRLEWRERNGLKCYRINTRVVLGHTPVAQSITIRPDTLAALVDLYFAQDESQQHYVAITTEIKEPKAKKKPHRTTTKEQAHE